MRLFLCLLYCYSQRVMFNQWCIFVWIFSSLSLPALFLSACHSVSVPCTYAILHPSTRVRCPKGLTSELSYWKYFYLLVVLFLSNLLLSITYCPPGCVPLYLRPSTPIHSPEVSPRPACSTLLLKVFLSLSRSFSFSSLTIYHSLPPSRVCPPVLTSLFTHPLGWGVSCCSWQLKVFVIAKV